MMKARCLKHYWSQRTNAAAPDYGMNEFRAEKSTATRKWTPAVVDYKKKNTLLFSFSYQGAESTLYF